MALSGPPHHERKQKAGGAFTAAREATCQRRALGGGCPRAREGERPRGPGALRLSCRSTSGSKLEMIARGVSPAPTSAAASARSTPCDLMSSQHRQSRRAVARTAAARGSQAPAHPGARRHPRDHAPPARARLGSDQIQLNPVGTRRLRAAGIPRRCWAEPAAALPCARRSRSARPEHGTARARAPPAATAARLSRG